MAVRLRQIPESLLAQLWRARAVRQRSLATRDGTRLRVLYPGRPSADAGPDFRDALLEVPGEGVIKGDVEIHLRQRDWQGHGHHLDSNYNGVVLHAALRAEGAIRAPLACGRTTPVVSLEPLLGGGGEGETAGADPWPILARHDYPRPATAEEMGKLLDRAGDERFLIKAGALGQRMIREEPRQVLYEALLEALGYSRNRDAFLELARKAPYRDLRQIALRHPPGERCRALVAALLQASEGLAWHTFRVRPSNHPRRRVVGAAVLMWRHLQRGLEEGLADPVRRSRWAELLGGIETWAEDGKALIGRSRAADMVVNGVLPYFYARGRSNGDTTLMEASLRTYRNAPRLQQNELEREMAYLMLSPAWNELPLGARRQQGLIHLYRLLTQVQGS